MFERFKAPKSVPRFNQVSPRDLPHLLEWHSWHCVGLADACETPRAKKILRLLAADLAIEAESHRRRWQERDLAALTPHVERLPSLSVDMRDGRTRSPPSS